MDANHWSLRLIVEFMTKTELEKKAETLILGKKIKEKEKEILHVSKSWKKKESQLKVTGNY